MKYLSRHVIFVLLLCWVCPVLAQSTKKIHLQYGVSFNLKWEIVPKYGYLSNFRFDVAGGAGAMLNKNIMPLAQYSVSLFQGGLGSSLSVKERSKINIENALVLGVMAGTTRNNDIYFRRPVYTMGRFIPTPLYNPFNYYINIATTHIFRLSKFATPNYLGKNRFSQRVGSFSVGTPGFDLNYYNDATPFQWLGLGDGKDRYWTGGGFVNFHLNNYYDTSTEGKTFDNRLLRNVFIGFDRFTGHYPESFEVANALRLNNVPYGDKTQAFFNKGRFYAGVESASIPGFAPVFSLNDRNEFDVQYFIHHKRKQPVHKTLHSKNNGINLFYSKNYWNIK